MIRRIITIKFSSYWLRGGFTVKSASPLDESVALSQRRKEKKAGAEAKNNDDYEKNTPLLHTRHRN